jgi:hypothetical protein
MASDRGVLEAVLSWAVAKVPVPKLVTRESRKRPGHRLAVEHMFKVITS